MSIINGKTDNGVLILSAQGRIDSTNAPQAEAEIEALRASEAHTSAILDLEDLEYISSAGLRVLLKYHKQMSRKGGMTISNINELVQEVLDVTGFTEIITIA